MQSHLGSSSNSRSKARTLSKKDEHTVMSMALQKGRRQLRKLEHLDDVPPAITVIIARCLNADINECPRHATELSRNIEDVFLSLESGGSKVLDKKRFKD